jgi:predicted DCC family thiol-disulfide oxidoreductase YuxK
MAKPLMLYDGYCVLCNGVVNFVSPRQKPDALEYSSLQSPRGQAILQKCGLSTTKLDTFVLYDNGRCFTRSSAALRLAGYMRFPWPLAQIFLLVPPFIRNMVYNWVARNRFKWFGRLPNEPKSDLAQD